MFLVVAFIRVIRILLVQNTHDTVKQRTSWWTLLLLNFSRVTIRKFYNVLF